MDTRRRRALIESFEPRIMYSAGPGPAGLAAAVLTAAGAHGYVPLMQQALAAQLAPAELRRIRGFNPTPGMPAEVMIETSARTFAQYLIKPIEDSLSRAFRED